MVTEYIKDLAEAIGWTFVNDGDGYNVYQYITRVSKYESLCHLLRLYNNPNALELYDMVQTVKKVLPYKLRRRVGKFLNNITFVNAKNITELAKFTIEEYKEKCDYAKLNEYASFAGTNLEDMGYKFEYTINKKKMAEIVAKIETGLPIEYAPNLGKIKKLDYKIAYVRSAKNKMIENN